MLGRHSQSALHLMPIRFDGSGLLCFEERKLWHNTGIFYEINHAALLCSHSVGQL